MIPGQFGRSLESYETRIGQLSRQALEAGGDRLLDRVTADMAVATRHLERIRAGNLALTLMVEREVERSLTRAAMAIMDHALREGAGT